MKTQLLIIDDNKMMGSFLSHLFEKEYEVKWFTTGEEAMVWMDSPNIPELIICDYELNGMTGLDFLKHIKKTGFFKDIPIIMLSGKSSRENKIECLKSGADDFIVKPFNPTELRVKTENLIRKKV